MRTFSIIFFAVLTLETQVYGALGPHGEVYFEPQSKVYQTRLCPMDSPGLRQILIQINELKSALRGKEECAGLSESMETMGDSPEKVLHLERFLDLIRLKKNQILSPEEAGQLKEQGEIAVRWAVQLLGWIRSSNDECLSDENRAQLVSKASGLVLTVTQALAQVAGPYGVPISVGGALAASLLGSLDAFQKSQGGLNYQSRPENLDLYANSLCAYFELRKKAQILLEPSRSLEGLSRIKSHLEGQLESMTSQCEKCQEIKNLHLSFESLPPARGGDEESAHYINNLKSLVDAADEGFRAPLGSHTLESLRVLRFIQEEMAEITPNNGRGEFKLQRLLNQMDLWFFRQEAPKFLGWHVREAQKIMAKYQSFASRLIHGSLGHWFLKVSAALDPLSATPDTWTFYDLRLFKLYQQDVERGLGAGLQSGKILPSQRAALKGIEQELNTLLKTHQNYCEFYSTENFLWPEAKLRCTHPLVSDAQVNKSEQEKPPPINVDWLSTLDFYIDRLQIQPFWFETPSM